MANANGNVNANVSDEEINYTIYRYLQEKGYIHAAFSFEHECQITNAGIDAVDVPDGTLRSILQTGLNFMRMEVEASPHALQLYNSASMAALSEFIRLLKVHGQAANPMEQQAAQPALTENESFEDEDPAVISGNDEFTDREVFTIQAHKKRIFGSQWNPRNSLFATVSMDCTARIWRIPGTEELQRRDETMEAKMFSDSVFLPHYIRGLGQADAQLSMKPKQNDVNVVGWNRDGALVATGSQEGAVRVWSTTGTLVHQSGAHTTSVTALKWNSLGNFFVTGTLRGMVGVWNGITGNFRTQNLLHDGTITDIDWKDNEHFVTCSSDSTIKLSSVTSSNPLLIFTGHSGEVNCVKVSPFGSTLASGADDNKVKLWCSKSSRPIRDLEGHGREVYALDWCPVNTKGVMLASASFDGSVKIWDVYNDTGEYCKKTLSVDLSPIHCLTYSPDGRFLACGSMNGRLVIWNVADGKVLRKFSESTTIHELKWKSDGKQLTAAYDSGQLSMFDVRRLNDIL